MDNIAISLFHHMLGKVNRTHYINENGHSFEVEPSFDCEANVPREDGTFDKILLSIFYVEQPDDKAELTFLGRNYYDRNSDYYLVNMSDIERIHHISGVTDYSKSLEPNREMLYDLKKQLYAKCLVEQNYIQGEPSPIPTMEQLEDYIKRQVLVECITSADDDELPF